MMCAVTRLSQLLRKFVQWYTTPTGMLSAVCISCVGLLVGLGWTGVALLVTVGWIGVVLPYKFMLERRDWVAAFDAANTQHRTRLDELEHRTAALGADLARTPTAEEVRTWQLGVERSQADANNEHFLRLDEIDERQSYAFFERASLTEALERMAESFASFDYSAEISGEVQTVASLHAALGSQHTLPALGGDALSSSAAAALVAELRRGTPEVMVILGTGVSTIIAALAIAQNENGKIIALEHDLRRVHQTQNELANRNLEKFAKVLHLPLSHVRFDGAEQLWYDLPSDWLNEPIELLFISGENLSETRVNPALAVPMLADHLVSRTSVLVHGVECDGPAFETWRDDYALRPSSSASTDLSVFRF